METKLVIFNADGRCVALHRGAAFDLVRHVRNPDGSDKLPAGWSWRSLDGTFYRREESMLLIPDLVTFDATA